MFAEPPVGVSRGSTQIGFDGVLQVDVAVAVTPAIERVAGVLPETSILVVFAIVIFAFSLFVTETLPVDVTALSVLVLLVALEPWTQIGPTDGLMGFSNHATITVLALFIVSDAIRQTGVIQTIGRKIVDLTGDNEARQTTAIMGLAGSTAGIVNNTPIVAVLIPMVMDIADRTGTSPSKLLIPLSYAAMMGGMLTLIGTAPNLIASEASARLIDRPFTMFEFTKLGAIQLVVGTAFVIGIGRHLIPARLEPAETLFEQFEMSDYLTEVTVEPDSQLIGKRVVEIFADEEIEGDVIRIRRGDRTYAEPLAGRHIRAGDQLLFRSDRETLLEFVEAYGVQFSAYSDASDESGDAADDKDEPSRRKSTEDLLEKADDVDLVLAEVMVVPRTSIVGQTLRSINFRQRFGGSVLALRRGGRPAGKSLASISLRGGDVLLVQTTESNLKQLARHRNFVVTKEIVSPPYRRQKAPLAIGITLAAVAIAAVGLTPISISALGGIVALVLTGCLTPGEMYEAVDWNVIFLLAGLIPLGVAMERSGGAQYLAEAIVPMAEFVPILVFLWIFYMLTTILTEMVSNVGAIILMAPVAVDVAHLVGANPFAFILLTAFAASTSLMTPIGYQTNLMIYEKGGYRFTDFMRIGVPLQVVLGIVTSLGVVFFWGV
ncbi:MAG: SLC13 family permease [Natronomonas sp.]